MSRLNVPMKLTSPSSSLASSILSVDKVDEEEIELISLSRYGSRDDLLDNDYVDNDELSDSFGNEPFDSDTSETEELMKSTIFQHQKESLHHAAYVGNLNLMQNIVKYGVDINGRDSFGQTPLHCAILAQQLKATQFLLDHKAKVHVLDHKQDSPMHAAVRTGNTKILEELLVDPRIDINIHGKEKVTALHLAAQMEYDNALEVCKILLLSGADITAKDISGRTPLCMAVVKGSETIADCLFRHAQARKNCEMSDLLYNVDQNGSNILHFAVDTGQLKMVEICISYGARVDKVKESDGTTAVHMACTYGSFEILKALLKSVSYVYSYSLPDNQGLTCLHKAAMYDHIEVMKFLIDQGIELNDVDHDLRTPLLLAASRGCTSAVELLLEEGADSALRDLKHRTVLHSAVGHSETLTALLKHVGVRNMMSAIDEEGSTALHYAAQGGFLKNVILLQQRWTRDQSANKYSSRIRNHKGDLPLHLAARHGWIDVAKNLLQSRDFRQIDVLNDNDKTPLHCAAEEGHSNMVAVLLDHQAAITKDRDGRTPLHMAAAKGSLKSVVKIVKAKPRSINEVDKDLNAALHVASQAGHANIVCFLLSIKEQEVNLNAFNQNVLDVAVANEHAEVAMALAQHARWKDVLHRTKGAEDQIQLLVTRLPHVAERFLDNCITKTGSPDSPAYKVEYDFRFLQGMPEENDYSFCSLDALETMVRCKRLVCLTHPLCQAFLDIKWRKVGLNEVIPQFILFFTYIVSLGCLIIYQPCGRPDDYKKLNLSEICVPGDFLYYGTWPFYIEDDGLTSLRAMYWICLSICCLRVPKELSVMAQGLKRYVSDAENVFNFIAMCLTITFFVYVIPFGDRSPNRSSPYVLTVITVMLSGILFIKHLRSYKVFGLYVTMVMKIIKTFISVGFLLLMFIIAFSFSFYMLNTRSDQVAFATLYQSMFTSFVWMLGEFEYKDVLVDKPQKYLPWLNYFFFILYVICVPIIFLNLLIGLAVGDIDRIQSSAELEVHARQVERLIQIERGFSKMLRKRTKVYELTTYPNVKSSARKRVVDFLVSLVTQARDENRKEDTTLRTRLEKHEERISDVYGQLRKQTQQFNRVLQTIQHIEDYLNKTDATGSATDTTSLPSLINEPMPSRP